MRAAAILALLTSSIVSSGALAGTGSKVLEDVTNDARRSAENSAHRAISKEFPYGGSIYGLPGQTRSDSIRESAIRGALGGMFGSCKKGGMIDLSKGGLGMQVGDLLANSEVKPPQINTMAGANPGLLGNASSLIPKPTEYSGDQVKVNGTWMSRKEYQEASGATQAELLRQQREAQVAQQQSGQLKPATKSVTPPSAPEKRAPVSKIWSPSK